MVWWDRSPVANCTLVALTLKVGPDGRGCERACLAALNICRTHHHASFGFGQADCRAFSTPWRQGRPWRPPGLPGEASFEVELSQVGPGEFDELAASSGKDGPGRVEGETLDLA